MAPARIMDSGPTRVLVVCLGNICRSPMAEGVLRQLASVHGLAMEVDSAGTADYHVGEAPDRRAIAAAAQAGMDIRGLRARQVQDQDLVDFDWILAMDADNLLQLQQRCKGHCPGVGRLARIGLYLDPWGQQGQGAVVADPYFGDAPGFARCLKTLQVGAERFIAGWLAESNAETTSRNA